MKNGTFKSIALTLALLLSPGLGYSDEQVTEYPTYSDFLAGLHEAMTKFGPAKDQSRDPRELPQSDVELQTWLNWAPVFVSDEPDLCPSSTDSFDFSFRKTVDTTECFTIDAAKRRQSATEPPACDQQNAHFFACFS